MARRANPEQAIQKAVFQHLAARAAPGVVAFAVPNGGYRTPREAAILKGLGVMAGIPDIFCIHRGRVVALELKAEGGKPTSVQVAAVASIREAGGFAAIVYGLDEALRCLERLGILRGRAA